MTATYYHKVQEFRSFGYQKNYFKSITVTLQGNECRKWIVGEEKFIMFDVVFWRDITIYH
jgi:hypothetical protein